MEMKKETEEEFLDRHYANIKRIQKELELQNAKQKEADYVQKMSKRKHRR